MPAVFDGGQGVLRHLVYLVGSHAAYEHQPFSLHSLLSRYDSAYMVL